MRARATIFKAVAVALAGGLLLTGMSSLSGSASAATKAKGIVIAASGGPFGPMLVVGSGPYAGYTLYYITSDQPALNKYGCTIIAYKSINVGPCTGPSNDSNAEWPAITTAKGTTPVAGAGVNQKLLASVSRPGVGVQVTYAGHPLYLFDDGPGQITGVGWDEPSLPPDHGVWWLMSPSGIARPWPEKLSTMTVGSKTVLAAVMLDGGGYFRFPVYSYSKDTTSKSACTGGCAIGWPPLITDGTPGVVSPLAPSKVSTIKRGDGTVQVAYRGKPLYLFSNEAIGKDVAAGGLAALGNGAGVKAGGGVFELVTP